MMTFLAPPLKWAAACGEGRCGGCSRLGSWHHATHSCLHPCQGTEHTQATRLLGRLNPAQLRKKQAPPEKRHPHTHLHRKAPRPPNPQPYPQQRPHLVHGGEHAGGLNDIVGAHRGPVDGLGLPVDRGWGVGGGVDRWGGRWSRGLGACMRACVLFVTD